MLSLEDVHSLLQDRRCSVVAEKTGLTVQTVINIRNGEKCNYTTLKLLSDYLERKKITKKERSK